MKFTTALKTTFLLFSLSCDVMGSDNCYIFERGSDSWLNCKDQARDNEKQVDQINANMRELSAEEATAQTADTQTEQYNMALQAAVRELQRQQAEGN